MGVTEVRAVVDAVGEQAAQPRKHLVDSLNDQHGTITMLGIGRVHGTDYCIDPYRGFISV